MPSASVPDAPYTCREGRRPAGAGPWRVCNIQGAMSMVPITYQVVGEEDYALKISVGEQGGYVVESETYTSQEPRKGALSEAQSEELVAAIEALGLPREHPLPEGATAFEAQLTIGAPGHEVNYVFWEGALEDDPPLNRLIRLLERL